MAITEQLAIAPAPAPPADEPGELATTLHEMLSLLAQCEEPEDSEEAAALDEDVKQNVVQAVTQKLRRYQAFFSFCKAQTEECKAEIERLQARKKAIESGRDRLRKYLARAMNGHRIKRLDAGTVVFTLMPGACSLLITDAEQVPYAFKQEEIVVKIDDAAVKRALQAQEKVPGATLTVGEPFVTVR
jgi:DNA repair exonuclease SbcCD ATPase subunit